MLSQNKVRFAPRLLFLKDSDCRAIAAAQILKTEDQEALKNLTGGLASNANCFPPTLSAE